MKFPKSVNIYGKNVPVILKENLKNDDGEVVGGLTNGHTIWINSDEPKRKWKGILCHEMWHCFVRRSGVIQNPDHNEGLEEVEAEGFENLIHDNFIIRFRNGEDV